MRHPSPNLFAVDGIHLGHRPADKVALLRHLAEEVAIRARCDMGALLDAILKRETLGSTGVGEGVALPHARLKPLAVAAGAVAVLAEPLEFGAIDDAPVDIVVFLALPEAPPAMALQTLSGLARGLRTAEVRARLRGARDPATAHALLCGL